MNSVLLDSSFIKDFCNNVADFVKAFGSYAVLIIGIFVIVIAVIQIVKIFAAKQTAGLLITIGCLLFGGFLTFGGWKILTTEDLWGGLGKNTLENVNNGNSPTTIGDLADSAGGTTTLEMAKHGLSIIAKDFIVPFGTMLAVSVGVLLVVIAVFQIAKHFHGKGKSQISWIKVAAMAVIGSVLFTATPTNNDGGWTWIRDKIVGGTKDSIINIADGNSTDQSEGLTADGLHPGADPDDTT